MMKSIRLKLAVLVLSVFLAGGTVISTPAHASDPFLGDIVMVGFRFEPRGYMFCNGQLLEISQYQALFSLLGTTYGGNGRTTFALPDLRGRMAIHTGPGYVVGQKLGEETVTLTQNQLGGHTHHVKAATSLEGDSETPEDNAMGWDLNENQFSTQVPDITMKTGLVKPAGSASPESHNNMPPYLAINYCIAVTGAYPSRN